jgi:exosortase family protein XrtF
LNLKKPEFNFLFLFIPSILLWFFFYHYLYKIDGFLNLEVDLLTSFSSLLSYQSNTLLSFFKFKTTTEVQGDMVITKILDYPYSHGVWIGEPCNGIKVFGLFTIFIISFKGKVIDKLWFIPIGILILHCINVIRVAILTYISATNPYILDFNHNITFQLIVYVSMLGLWYWWIIQFSKINEAKT